MKSIFLELQMTILHVATNNIVMKIELISPVKTQSKEGMSRNLKFNRANFKLRSRCDRGFFHVEEASCSFCSTLKKLHGINTCS